MKGTTKMTPIRIKSVMMAALLALTACGSVASRNQQEHKASTLMTRAAASDNRPTVGASGDTVQSSVSDARDPDVVIDLRRVQLAVSPKQIQVTILTYGKMDRGQFACGHGIKMVLGKSDYILFRRVGNRIDGVFHSGKRVVQSVPVSRPSAQSLKIAAPRRDAPDYWSTGKWFADAQSSIVACKNPGFSENDDAAPDSGYVIPS